MESAARPVRAVAHDLYEVQPLGSQRSSHPGVRTAPSRTAHRSRSSGIGLHDGQGPSRRSGALTKRGPQAIGRYPGGLTTKSIWSQPMPAPPSSSLFPQVKTMTHGMDTASSKGGTPRTATAVLGSSPRVRSNRNTPTRSRLHTTHPAQGQQPQPKALRPAHLQARNEIERLFRRLKAYRHIFVRYDQLDVIFLAFITLALIHDTLKA